MLKEVQRPDGSVVSFAYDAFGRRIEKKTSKTITRFLWDGNVPLHEWKEFDYKETTDNDRITWVFQGFTPVAKIQGDKHYSIISDHLGTPLQAIDTQGNKVWERELDIYGKVRKETEETANFVPFLFQGQYLDTETELVYNYKRYYSQETGAYISQDPIGLAGNNPTIYGYVFDSNIEIDPFGLDCVENKNIKKLHNGESVNVKSFKEANALLKKAFPNAKKSRGASPNSMKLSEKDKTFKLDKNRTPVYKKDYLKDENGIIYGHSQLPDNHIHKTNPHINILTSEGNKVSINILK
ncbi:RHS repeat domain-containing protein [Treponema pedis]|uniref:RHS repeat domain-containing protein n=2 Tax=Treponema pedis TaxID=409322 RepID=UPI000400CA85|nr:RHS repeat-associated core domain-containing protein [Treponema pedis]